MQTALQWGWGSLLFGKESHEHAVVLSNDCGQDSVDLLYRECSGELVVVLLLEFDAGSRHIVEEEVYILFYVRAVFHVVAAFVSTLDTRKELGLGTLVLTDSETAAYGTKSSR